MLHGAAPSDPVSEGINVEKHWHVVVAVVFSLMVPAVPFIAWCAGGTVLSPTGFVAFLVAGVAYLALVAVATVICSVRELSRFFTGYDMKQSVMIRNLLPPPLSGLPPDQPISSFGPGDEA